MQKEAVMLAVFEAWRGVSERDWQECDCSGKIGDRQALA